MNGQKKFIRLRSLSEDCSEEAICERILGKRTATPKTKQTKTHQTVQTKKVNLLIDIQNFIKTQNSPGYERWEKIFNLKQAAKGDFNHMSGRKQAIDVRLKEITTLQKHIGAYVETREVYAGYSKVGYSKKFLAKHEAAITAHKAAKAFFDE